jgi:HK97 family phage prohead protease
MPMTFESRNRTQDTLVRRLQERLAQRVSLRIRSARQFGVETGPTVNGATISGLVCPYDSPSITMTDSKGKFRERYAKNCFSGSLRDPDLIVCWQHNDSLVLGRVGSGTASFEETDQGLFATASPPDAQWASDLLASMRRHDVHSMSAGFVITSSDWSNSGGERTRIIRSGILVEASIVTRPAYPSTTAVVQDSADQDGVDEDELEEDLLWAASATNHRPLELALRSARRHHEGGVLTLQAAQRELDALEAEIDPLRKYHRELEALRAK